MQYVLFGNSFIGHIVQLMIVDLGTLGKKHVLLTTGETMLYLKTIIMGIKHSVWNDYIHLQHLMILYN